MPRISVIVPIYNGIAFLQSFFHSLGMALPDQTQLILIDDASTEPVFDAVPAIPRASDVLRLRNDQNSGYSVAVNRGFEVANGDIIVQLNTDLILDPNSIKAMIDLIEREPRVGIVGSKLIFPTTGLVQHVGMAFGHHTKPHVYFELPSSHPLCKKTREVQITTGATVGMTRAVLDQLGPLDERYFNHNEDIDHCLKARRLGLKNFVCAQSIAYHWESQSGPARFARVEASEASFWSTWGGAYDIDLGRFVDEALDHVIAQAPSLETTSFEILNLSRGVDESIVLERLAQRWRGIQDHVRPVRQLNNPVERLWLPMVLPHWVVTEPKPFIYLVDQYRELEENVLWFQNRRRVVEDELIVDLRAGVVRTSEGFC
ncbi:MAG: glycosyltransferase [Candidatus Eisenbacteria bacterium]|uniref:Glycosyltransferase n=1 Tax=Eiseniibacteriota bacterium TaxID=2212470 RepID=A0A948WBG5_UNCEI|nr:glycosyltransferase [Candidatus Eisenbacteria bacterium]MBU2689933.1 glycosyltransferase [Candidatus Eisenbacteria bacterium]